MPTCGQTTATFLILLILGIGFLIVGVVILRRRAERSEKSSM
jgi:hypothetical protein